ncbi:MAG TPA: hypothetical protein VM889_11845 [Candidatus Thermoplasmatota archaeon]|nr:hypothetical protein [Candidatus Thermoplasmatota archaeon]
MRAPAVLGLVLAILAVAVVADAQASTGCMRPTLVAPEGLPGLVDPGASVTIPLVIENPNEAPVARAVARLNVTGPPGWTFQLETNPVSLGPGDEILDHLTVTAPARGAGNADGRIVVTAAFACQVEGVSAIQTSASSTLTLEAGLAPSPLPWGALASLAVVVVGAVSVVAVARSRESRLVLTPERSAFEVTPADGGRVSVAIENRRGEPVTALVSAEASAGWTAFVAVPEVELEGKEEIRFWVSVRPPPGTRMGAKGRVVVRAASRAHPRDVAERELDVTVGQRPWEPGVERRAGD